MTLERKGCKGDETKQKKQFQKSLSIVDDGMSDILIHSEMVESRQDACRAGCYGERYRNTKKKFSY
jgi:hypothetical protein